MLRTSRSISRCRPPAGRFAKTSQAEQARQWFWKKAEVAEVMKLEMRRVLARESYEEKIRKVGQLVALTRTFPRRMTVHPRSSTTMTLSESEIPHRFGKRKA